MKAAEQTSRHATASPKTSAPFFNKSGSDSFFGTESTAEPFFSPKTVQPKLTIGSPNDVYEQQADAVADQVVAKLSQPDSKLDTQNSKPTPSVQRQNIASEPEEKLQLKENELEKTEEKLQMKPIFESLATPPPPSDEDTVQRKCADCDKEDKEKVPIQKKNNGDTEGSASADLSSRLSNSKGGGSPLSDGVRGPMESAIGADFSGVRIHTGSESVQMNRELNAQAFAHGNDVYFGAGKYNPSSASGQHLLAHELVHTVQQGGVQKSVQRSVRDSVNQARQGRGVNELHGQTGAPVITFVDPVPGDALTPPTIRHDHGFLDDGSGNIDESLRESPTMSDGVELLKWTAKLNAAELLRPDLIDGTSAYRHFLYGGGTTRTFNYERFIANDVAGAVVLNSVIEDARMHARDRHNVYMLNNSNPTNTAFVFRSNPIGVGNDARYPYPGTENWQKAIGAHTIWFEANVDVALNHRNITMASSSEIVSRTFNVHITIHVEDRYNFNPGAADIATGSPDAANGRFEITGLGQEYLNQSEISRTIHWNEGIDTVSTPLPANPTVTGSPRLPQ